MCIDEIDILNEIYEYKFNIFTIIICIKYIHLLDDLKL